MIQNTSMAVYTLHKPPEQEEQATQADEAEQETSLDHQPIDPPPTEETVSTRNPSSLLQRKERDIVPVVEEVEMSILQAHLRKLTEHRQKEMLPNWDLRTIRWVWGLMGRDKLKYMIFRKKAPVA
jgi:hypothetical protein